MALKMKWGLLAVIVAVLVLVARRFTNTVLSQQGFGREASDEQIDEILLPFFLKKERTNKTNEQFKITMTKMLRLFAEDQSVDLWWRLRKRLEMIRMQIIESRKSSNARSQHKEETLVAEK